MSLPPSNQALHPALGRTALAALLCWFCLGGAGTLQAREGVYLELGVVNHSIAGDLESSPVRADDKGVGEARLGALEDGSGVAVGGGYGFTENLAFDIQIGLTSHDARFAPTGGAGTAQTATLRTVVAGGRFTYPAGDLFDLFARVGLGGYELVYRDANVRTSDGSTVGDVRLLGRGTAISAGAEMLLGAWGIALVYTRHEASLDAVDSPNFEGPLQAGLDLSVNAVALQVVYQLPR